jgi:hypothetical protein
LDSFFLMVLIVMAQKVTDALAAVHERYGRGA